MIKEKVLLTGSLGFIPSNFIRKAMHRSLQEKYPYDYCLVDKATNNQLMNNIYINNNINNYFADICDEHIMDKIFAIEKPDIILHMAAETAVDKSIATPTVFAQSNVVGTQVMINMALKYKVKKFIYSSTDEVYGALTSETDKAWTEETVLNPRNPYSASKAAAELLVKAAHQTYGLPYIITRSCNNFGFRQTTDKLIPKIINCILKQEKIPLFGKGEQIRDWLFVGDNCTALLTLIHNEVINEVYNISANQELSNLELVNQVCNIMGAGWDLISFVNERPGHDFRYAIDASKLKTLGWKSEKSFKDGLAETCEWYKINQWFFKSRN